ncbi:MAG: NAD-dependent epimerase/dehydratase family protein [Bacteroidales bacterium]
MPRILIIGKNSFIGKNYINNSNYKDIVEVDVKNVKPEDVDLSGFDVIIHLAAIVHQTHRITLEEYQKVNCELPVKIAEIAKGRGVKQFVFISSSKVYGGFDQGQMAWTEFSDCNPKDSYGISKLNAENKLLALVTDSFCISIIRTPIVYGPGVRANMLQLIKLIDRCPILPLGIDFNSRSITFVENIVAFIDRVIALKVGGVFIAKDKESPSIKKLTELIAHSLGRRRFIFNPGKLFLNLLNLFLPKYFERLYGSSILDNSATLKILDFEPQFSMKEGIMATVEYYKRGQYND